ncbi:hypothetical protein H0H87_006610, partial [Tephrocybe sp. NHM501043]
MPSSKYHPYSSSNTSESIASSTSALDHSNLLTQLGLVFDPHYKLLYCITCQSAWIPTAIPGHLAQIHKTRLNAQQKANLDAAVQFYGVTTSNRIVPTSDLAIDGLKLYLDAYLCIACDYACLQRTSLMTHFSNHHKANSAKGESQYTRGPVQTFFNPVPLRYFRVCLPEQHDQSLFDIFMAKEEPKLIKDHSVSPQNAREIPPMLACTQWHLHLEHYLDNRDAREKLCKMFTPYPISQGNALWEMTWKYLETIRNLSNDTSMRCRILLNECPR